jgi:SAM-dependent methyltransferase
VAKCISIAGHDRAVDPEGDAASRWARELERWAIPEEILAHAPETPWTCVPADFAVDGDGPLCTASTPFELEVLPDGGDVLDVGCGGGRAALALVPPAARIVGVDQSGGMLRQLQEAAAVRAPSVTVETIHGRWPDIASSAPLVDLVVCHHVVYNAPDIGPFVDALTAHARRAVVVELTAVHPQSAWNEAWRHFWALDRPDGPTADDLVELLGERGLPPEVWRHHRPPEGPWPFADEARAVRSTLRRLCLTPERADEVADFLHDHPLAWPDEVVTLRWPPPRVTL